jgi:uncharacterized protein
VLPAPRELPDEDLPRPPVQPDAELRSRRHRHYERILAVLEVLLCSGVPTQLAIGQLLSVIGFPPFGSDGEANALPVFTLAIADTIVLLALIGLLLHARGERVRDLLLGARPVARDVVLGVLLVPVLFVGVGVTVLTVRRLLPWTHNVTLNPFVRLMRTPTEAGLFAVVAMIAGGLREEVQRAFLLHRFETSLGGATVGLVIISVAFGLGHIPQGWDAAIATGLLGVVWGVLYIRRRSAVAPVVSHAGYNAAQILQSLAVQSLRA